MDLSTLLEFVFLLYAHSISDSLLDMCNWHMPIYSEIHMFYVNASREEFYPKNMNCRLVIQTSTQNEQFAFFVELLDVFHARDCDTDWLELRDGRTTSSPFVDGINEKLCGSSTKWQKRQYVTKSNFLLIRFKSGSHGGAYNGFSLLINRFHYAPCQENEYMCSYGQCIDQSITCLKYDPCADGSSCPEIETSTQSAVEVSTQSAGDVFGIIIGIAILVFIIGFVINVVWKRRRVRTQRSEQQAEVFIAEETGTHPVEHEHVTEHTDTETREEFDNDRGRLCPSRSKAIFEPKNPKATTDSQGSTSYKTKIAPLPPATERVDTGHVEFGDSAFIDLRKSLNVTQAVQMHTLLSYSDDSDESTTVKEITQRRQSSK